MVLLTVDALDKKINEKVIAEDVSFSIDEGEKIALIGVNGTGKSTLLKVLAGQMNADGGTILRKNGLKMQFISQNPQFSKPTVWQEIKAADPDGKSEDYVFKTILTKLGLMDFEAPIDTLSGGQQKRLALACGLAVPCDLLMLDEPTNHLDEMMVEWLENELIRRKCAVLMVTHDRYFLDRVCTKIFELEQGHLYVHHGSYEVYVQDKEARVEQEAADERAYRNLYRKELAWVRAGVQARSTKQKGRLKRFDELRQHRRKQQEQTLKLQAPSQRLGKKTIEWQDLGFAYGSNELFHGFSYQLKRQDRIGIIGHNGCGKSTLLNVIAGDLKPTEGTITWGETVKIGYFRQGDSQVDVSMRMIDYIRKAADVIDTGKEKITAAQLLERFLFPRSMHYTTIDRLSGGERRRLYLCRVLMQAPNILLLDEPTNDLDLLTLDVLEDYLDAFPGAVLTVSHDRYFLDRVCDFCFVYQPDKTWRGFPGGYSDYRVQEEKPKPKPKPRRHRPRTGLNYQEQKELEQLNQEMTYLQNEIDELNQAMSEPMNFEQMEKLVQKREQAESDLEEKTLRWMELEEKKEADHVDQ
ncbi:ABC-F family ATP-binding cassette domain-containing protein [Catenisphaera adipataccumulans]|jgi:ATP-binding cassette subfamily F protein uup|uniref:ATP-binding cassette subfamily F protein uup n=1 Tax=Catenisphaera adipataccumulans TaxID=700500 RepID=A0A7W8CZD3_9FIRM|nr:ABC-F family ATP-binding cassette domain-containing protein [Catenisphaera adipataccumulans]MBB5183809.1 ATP-binding cassette subfamily F protein uup [Catenisphaera adipataccumulans]